MVALKSSEADAFVARPDPARAVVLVFGPDAGLVSERVDAIVRASVDNPDDPFSLVRLDGDAIASDPARLVDEATTMPLFGGRRAIRLRAGGRNIVPAVEAVLAAPLQDCRVVIEAGDLKRKAPLRALVERAKNAAAIPCYEDGERDIARLIDDELRAAELTIAPDARDALARCSAATGVPRAPSSRSSRSMRKGQGASSSTMCWRSWRTRPRSRSTA